MPSQVAVLALHGMGSQARGYTDRFAQRLYAQLRTRGLSPAEVVLREGFWADLLAERETALWQRLSADRRLCFRSVRQFVVAALGDAIAYHSAPTTEYSTYYAVHQRAFDDLAALGVTLGSGGVPLVLVAHSLGSIILSDYLWDNQVGRGFGRDAFTRGETVAGFITFGSTIPLFTLALEQVSPIRFPGTGLTAAQRAAARWLNFYDRHDVLGYPLRPISPEYAAAVHADVEVSVGGLLTGWNPACHTQYWTSAALIEPLAALIASLAA